MKANIKTEKINEWVELYTDKLLDWAYYKTSNKEVAEDLVQETFIAAFKSLDKFEGKSAAKTWLMSILNHKIIDYYRKENRSLIQKNSIDEHTAQTITDNIFTTNGHWAQTRALEVWQEKEEELLDNEHFKKIFTNCIADLPEKWHIALTWKYFLEKSADEICQELQISTTNYWQIMHRSKLLLKKCIENKWK